MPQGEVQRLVVIGLSIGGGRLKKNWGRGD